MGTPAPTIPASIGMVEQEQNGVTNPSTTAASLPPTPLLPPKAVPDRLRRDVLEDQARR